MHIFSENLKEKIVQAKEVQQKASAKIKEVEANLADAKGYRDRQLKEAQDDMKKFKKASEESHKNWKKREQEAETLSLEIEDLKKTVQKAKDDAVKMDENIVAFQAKVNKVSHNKMFDCRSRYNFNQ